MISEEIHAGMRRRLRTLRLARHMAIKDFKTISPGTMGQYETVDLLKVTLATLIGLADEFGMEPIEFLGYLFGNETVFPRSGPTRNLEEVGLYLRDMPESTQELCVAVVRSIAQHERPVLPGTMIRQLTRREKDRVEHANTLSNPEDA